jgi:branched-subunit amino acid transport protein AzlD
VIRTGAPVTPAETLCWAGYNFIAFAVLPFAVFRRRYSSAQLSLHSSNRRSDLLVILVVLVLESTVQLSVASSSVLDLTSHQVLLGAPLTFALSFAGTVLPTMVFIYCILTPRYLRLTGGSVPTTVILGGLTYALLHFFDGWTDFTTPTDALLSTLYVLLFYTAPGMFKTFLTLRTGNAWVHVWAYHAIAPHTLIDTPMMTKVFSIH